jgi:hypothetical protein
VLWRAVFLRVSVFSRGQAACKVSTTNLSKPPASSLNRPLTPPPQKKDASIPVPPHIVVSRDSLPDGAADPPGFIEEEDYVEMDGVRIEKPFVEKPISGEDHNIHIYYPHSMVGLVFVWVGGGWIRRTREIHAANFHPPRQGGGVKRLFRKVENKSADYDPTHPGTVRRIGSFIYETFLTTGGTDVKVRGSTRPVLVDLPTPQLWGPGVFNSRRAPSSRCSYMVYYNMNNVLLCR